MISRTIVPTLNPWSNERVWGVAVVGGSDGGPTGSSIRAVVGVGATVTAARGVVVVMPRDAEVVVRSTVDVDVVAGIVGVVDELGSTIVSVLSDGGSLVVVVASPTDWAAVGTAAAPTIARTNPATTSCSRRARIQAR